MPRAEPSEDVASCQAATLASGGLGLMQGLEYYKGTFKGYCKDSFKGSIRV